MAPNMPTAAKTRPAPYARSASSVDSFQVDDECQKLEQRLGIKLHSVDAKPKPVATPARTSVAVPIVHSSGQLAQQSSSGGPPKGGANPKVGANVQPKMSVSAVPKVPTQPGGATVPKGSVNVSTTGLNGAGGRSVVAKAATTTTTPGGVPVSAKSTPVKSPDMKRSKTGQNDDDGDLGVTVAKNLNNEFDRVEMAATVEPPAPHVGEVASAAEPDSDAGPQSSPQPTDDERPAGISRNIATLTTMPLGSSVEDLEGFETSHLDIPLLTLLKSMSKDVTRAEMLCDVGLWVKRRHEVGDIKFMDPMHSTAVMEISLVNTQLADRAKTLSEMRVESVVLEQKLSMAARAMTSRQYNRASEMFPEKNPAETDFYRAHAATIKQWYNDKMQPSLDAQKVYEQITADIEKQLTGMLDSLLSTSLDSCANCDEPVDMDLMNELDSYVQHSAGSEMKAPLDPPPGLQHEAETIARLKDHAEVANFKGMEEIGADASEPPTPHLRAQTNLLNRLDTTQLEAQTTPSRSPPQTETSEEAAPIRIGPSGRPETEDEYQARMAHNCYMRFSRSLKRNDCPKPVLEAAAGKKHNRAILGQLFEDYISSGENWMRSSLVANSTRRLSSKRTSNWCVFGTPWSLRMIARTNWNFHCKHRGLWMRTRPAKLCRFLLEVNLDVFSPLLLGSMLGVRMEIALVLEGTRLALTSPKSSPNQSITIDWWLQKSLC